MAATAARARSRGGKSALGFASYLKDTRRVSLSLVYVAPLFAAHEIGLRLVDSGTHNAVEHGLKELLWVLGPAVAYVHVLLALVIGCAIGCVLQARVPALKLYPPFLVESLLFALVLGPVLGFLTAALPLPARAGSAGPGLEAAVLASIGAGLYEELLFRLVLLGGSFLLIKRVLVVPETAAFALALVVSAATFAAYHHLGPYAEPWNARALCFRGLAGILLGLVFLTRGLGVAVYLHAFYDILYDLRAAYGAD